MVKNMERITQKMLKIQFDYLQLSVKQILNILITVESYSPGDQYGTRYRLESNGSTPFGSLYSLGKREFYETLYRLNQAFDLIRNRINEVETKKEVLINDLKAQLRKDKQDCEEEDCIIDEIDDLTILHND